jgi:hypothetical protein
LKRLWALGLSAVAITAAAVFLATPAGGISIVGHFVDDNGHLFENDIDAIAEAGITKGCNPPANTNYCPSLVVDRGAMAAFIRRALSLPSTNTDYFVDDNNSIFEGDINSIAEAGITKGCNPPANTRYCPTNVVDRGAMAAFLRRAFDLPSGTADYFVDDNGSIFEHDINAIAEANITKGCNPPSNNRYCPGNVVDRGAMAAFLRRGLGLPYLILQIPLGDHSGLSCSKDGETCSITVDVVSGRSYLVEEGLFQFEPASASELTIFNAGNSFFDLRLNGSTTTLTSLGVSDEGAVLIRMWSDTMIFSNGNHTLIGRWRWDGEVFRTTTVTVRAS